MLPQDLTPSGKGDDINLPLCVRARAERLLGHERGQTRQATELRTDDATTAKVAKSTLSLHCTTSISKGTFII